MQLFRMRVIKYVPKKLYGFLRGEGDFDVFFHLATFHPGPDVDVVRCSVQLGGQVELGAPPPILGELVDVHVKREGPHGRAPRADRVERVARPTMLIGEVESFNPTRRYGFVMGSDMVSYHLHESEISGGLMPIAGGHVTFYPGVRENRPRACHVRVYR